MGYSKTVELPNAYTASDTVLISNPASVDKSGDTYQLAKSVQVIQDVYPVSTLRVKWNIVFISGNEFSRVYKNGVPVGVEKANDGDKSDDISLTDFQINDTIEIWIKTNLVAGSLRCRNMTVCGNPQPFTTVV